MHGLRAKPFIALSLLAITVPDISAARAIDIESWVDRELIPYVASELSTHPRFRNESLRFVVMQDGNPQPVASALAIAMRDRLQNALIDTPGIRIAWQPDRSTLTHLPGTVDCGADQIHYYIGLEISEKRSGRFALSVRALDLEDRSWVTGFGKSWSGALSVAQQRAWQDVGTDQSFLGERDVPFDESQTDLLAAHLAHKLGCTLLQQLNGEYVANTMVDGAADSYTMIELVANNLAAYRALQLAPDGSGANATLDAKAHRVDNELYQYWITVTPTDSTSDLAAISASAYVHLSEPAFPIEHVALPPPIADVRPGTVLGSSRLIELNDWRTCNSRQDCFAVQTRSNADAVVFFLNHQLNHGLVRLAGQHCERRAAARVVRANESVNFSLLADLPGSSSWTSGNEWELHPDRDIYYVVAASDGKAARALARHVERLPQRCTASVRSGLQGAALQRWITELDAIANHWETRIDWQIIRVRNLY